MDSIARACWHITKLGQQFWNNRCKPYGIGIGQVPMLFLLYRKEGLSQEQISNYLAIDKAATAKTVAKLLSLGLVSRSSDPTDARCKRISLTAAGRDLQPLLEASEQAWQAILTEGLSPSQAADASTIIDHIRQNAIGHNQENVGAFPSTKEF